MIYPLWIGISLAASFWLCSFIQPFFYEVIGTYVPEAPHGLVWVLTYAALAFFPFLWLYKAGMWFGRNVLHVFHSPFSPLERWFDGLVSYALFYVLLVLVLALLFFGLALTWSSSGLPSGIFVLFVVALLATFFQFCKGWRGFFHLWATITAPLRRVLEAGRFGTGGSARFCGFLGEWTKPFRSYDDKLLLGKSLYGNLYVGLKLDKHFLTIGGTRGGKGVSAIIPNLRCWQENIFCIDPKGENATIMGRTLGAKVLDPYEIVENDKVERCGYNFLTDIDTDSPDMVSQINTLLEAIIIATSTKDPFWDNTSRILFTGLVAHVCTHPDFEGRRDLVSIYRLCYVTGEAKELLISEMENNTACYELVPNAAAILRTPSKNTESSILATLQTHLDFLKDRNIQKSVSGENTFSIYDLATKQLNIFVCLPVDDIKAQKPWLRLMLMWCFRAMTRSKERRSRKLLFVMDEFPKLGWLPVIEEAAGLVAGYNIRLWPIAQDVGQLRKLYGETWETFVSNASGVQFIAVNHAETLDYIGKRLGRSSHKREALGGLQSGPLVEYDEIEKILDPEGNLMLVKPGGSNALILKQCPYYACMSSYDYDAPPDHRSGQSKASSDWVEQSTDFFLWKVSERSGDWGFKGIRFFRWVQPLRKFTPLRNIVGLVFLWAIILFWFNFDPPNMAGWGVIVGKVVFSWFLFVSWGVFFDVVDIRLEEQKKPAPEAEQERRQAEGAAREQAKQQAVADFLAELKAQVDEAVKREEPREAEAVYEEQELPRKENVASAREAGKYRLYLEACMMFEVVPYKFKEEQVKDRDKYQALLRKFSQQKVERNFHILMNELDARQAESRYTPEQDAARQRFYLPEGFTLEQLKARYTELAERLAMDQIDQLTTDYNILLSVVKDEAEDEDKKD